MAENGGEPNAANAQRGKNEIANRRHSSTRTGSTNSPSTIPATCRGLKRGYDRQLEGWASRYSWRDRTFAFDVEQDRNVSGCGGRGPTRY